MTQQLGYMPRTALAKASSNISSSSATILTFDMMTATALQSSNNQQQQHEQCLRCGLPKTVTTINIRPHHLITQQHAYYLSSSRHAVNAHKIFLYCRLHSNAANATAAVTASTDGAIGRAAVSTYRELSLHVQAMSTTA
eukprot:13428-Heterococcus_DN1.PRE.1